MFVTRFAHCDAPGSPFFVQALPNFVKSNDFVVIYEKTSTRTCTQTTRSNMVMG